MAKFAANEVLPFATNSKNLEWTDQYVFEQHGTRDSLEKSDLDKHALLCKVPLLHIASRLNKTSLQILAKQHGVLFNTRTTKSDIINRISKLSSHVCQGCVTIFVPHVSCSWKSYHRSHYEIQKSSQYGQHKSQKLYRHGQYKNQKNAEDDKFPPRPPVQSEAEQIIKNFTKATSPKNFEESGCAVCGALNLRSKMRNISEINLNLNLLNADGKGFTRKERHSLLDPVMELSGPVIEKRCEFVCKSCINALKRHCKPKFALSKGLWIGDVPHQLKCLRYFERQLVACVQSNKCIFRVSVGGANGNGLSKMIANAISFQQPVQKIYHILPPPVKDMDDVIAFIFTGPNPPTQEDFNRTPLLIRRQKVMEALEWLKLNHRDYADLEISYKNLSDYPEDVPPVVVEYRRRDTNKVVEATSVHDTEVDDGTTTGICPLTVHGITGEQYANASTQVLKVVAMEHLTDMGRFLAVGRREEPEGIWQNPALYPQMFPWLFPYGLGGIGDQRHKGTMSDAAHKRHLLMYHDKRFQMDHEFCLIAFNHEQIKDATTSGFLMTERNNFDNVAERLVNVDTDVLKDISKRMAEGEKINPQSDEERACFDILKDVDHVGSHVNGSITNKRYMRNEIWSLSCFRGAPSWYITLSPADNKHPISLYLADTDTTFKPIIRTDDEKLRLITENPVAGARLFHFMISAFVEHVLGVCDPPRKPLK